VEPADEDLQSALARHGIELPPEQVEQLDAYRELLWSWNERLNLTRHTTYEKFVTRDVVDSQALAAWIPAGHEVLDAGTGGGVPGVMLAILRPDLSVSVCDYVGKKARAVESMVEELQLPVAVAHARAEELLELSHYNTVVARAVAALEKMIPWFTPYQHALDQVLIIKGRRWVEERETARHAGVLQAWELRRLSTYRTPGTDAESVILKLWPRGRDEP